MLLVTFAQKLWVNMGVERMPDLQGMTKFTQYDTLSFLAPYRAI